jgi:hypothetical protein
MMSTAPEDSHEQPEQPVEPPNSQAGNLEEPAQPPVKRRWQERVIDGLQDFLHRLLQQM